MALEARSKTSANFSMSGMTDIVFLLLVFFMLTSTLIVPTAQNVNLPQSNNQTQATPVLIVNITADRQVYVDDQIYDIADLEGVLRKKLEKYGEAPTIRLNADQTLEMEEVFTVLDIARKNRYKVILGTKPIS
ncbi:MAG: ExbD/TolR family protein [Bacteroidota bacterium]